MSSEQEELPVAASADYYRGFYDGFKAAKKAQDYPKIYPTQTLPKTEDLMWPDRLPSTSPFPPTMTTNRCGTCGIEMKGAWSYVCNHPNCPTKVTCGTPIGTGGYGTTT